MGCRRYKTDTRRIPKERTRQYKNKTTTINSRS